MKIQHPFVYGVAWPIATNGDESHSWVERDDDLDLLGDDDEAYAAVVRMCVGKGLTFSAGWAKPAGCNTLHPYVDLDPFPATIEHMGVYEKLYVSGEALRKGDVVVGEPNDDYVGDVCPSEDGNDDLQIIIREPYGGIEKEIDQLTMYIVFRELDHDVARICEPYLTKEQGT